MVHQRLKGRVEIFRFVFQNLAAGFVCQSLNVEIRRTAEFSHSRGPNHDAVLEPLFAGLRNDAAHDAAGLINRLRGCLAGRTTGTIEVTRDARDCNHHAATNRIAGFRHIIRGIVK